MCVDALYLLSFVPDLHNAVADLTASKGGQAQCRNFYREFHTMVGGNSNGDCVGDSLTSEKVNMITMFEAAKVGDAERIQSLIMDGADVQARDESGERSVRVP